MQNLTLQLSEIDKKVRLVLQKMEVLNAENTILKQQNKSLQEEIDRLKKGGAQLELSGLKGSEVLEEKNEIKKELDQYIIEIDQTIELLKAV